MPRPSSPTCWKARRASPSCPSHWTSRRWRNGSSSSCGRRLSVPHYAELTAARVAAAAAAEYPLAQSFSAPGRPCPVQNRRELLFSAAAAAAIAAAVTPKDVFAATATASDPAEVAKVNALYDDMVARQLRRSPETATGLGVDSGDMAWTKSQLSDVSLAALKENAETNAQQLKALRAIDRSKLAGMDAASYDTVEFVVAGGQAFNDRFAYNGAYGGAPYVISQLTGAYQQVPDFIDSQHVIETKADADAYMSRVEAFGRMLDQEVEVARHDAALGVIPADFTIDKALIQFKTMLGVAPDASPLVTSVARRAKEKGIAGDYAGVAAKLYAEKVRPALARQAALLRSEERRGGEE